MKYIIGLMALALASVGCMSVPDGLHVYESTNGCNSQGVCPWADGTVHNWYDASTHEIVVAPKQGLHVLAHEACHAHQQQEVIDETGHDVHGGVGAPDLHEWIDTDEADSYRAVVIAAGPAPWGDHGLVELEDYAESCARYLVHDPRFPAEPQRDNWFATHGF